MRKLFLALFAIVVSVIAIAVAVIAIAVAVIAFANAYTTNPAANDLENAKQLASRGDSEAADNLFKKCVKLASKSNNKEHVFLVDSAYGSFLLDFHRFDEAIAVLKEGADLAGTTGHYMNESFCLQKIALCQHYKYLELGVVPDRTAIQKANSLIEKEQGEFSDIARAHTVAALGAIYSDVGEYKKADQCFQTAMGLLQGLNVDKDTSVEDQIDLLIEQIRSAVARKDYEGANKIFISASGLNVVVS